MQIMMGRAMLAAFLGAGYLLAGRYDQAADLVNQALDVARRHKERGWEAWALGLCGEVAAQAGTEPTKAQQLYLDSIALATELGMRPLVAHCHLGLGKLHRLSGKREQAQEHLTSATTMYQEMDMRFWLEKAEAENREIQ